MGQKTHPSGFRLNTTQQHYSNWCQTNWRSYSDEVRSDNQIRLFLKKKLNAGNISDILIAKNFEQKKIFIKVFLAKPGVIVKEFSSEIGNLEEQIKQRVPQMKFVSIAIFEVEEPNLDATLLAEYISEMLVKRIAFKRAIRMGIDLAKQNDSLQGIKIQISGRLNGAEIARSEWVKEGRMPLQTLRAKISYVSTTAKTIYGILGIKLWIFKGEKLN
jgi:small subunit ribosomal protein S3